MDIEDFAPPSKLMDNKQQRKTTMPQSTKSPSKNKGLEDLSSLNPQNMNNMNNVNNVNNLD
jgi:hypothetical protein